MRKVVPFLYELGWLGREAGRGVATGVWRGAHPHGLNSSRQIGQENTSVGKQRCPKNSEITVGFSPPNEFSVVLQWLKVQIVLSIRHFKVGISYKFQLKHNSIKENFADSSKQYLFLILIKLFSLGKNDPN